LWFENIEIFNFLKGGIYVAFFLSPNQKKKNILSAV